MQVARDESRDIVGGRNQRSRAHGTTLGMGARNHHTPQRAAAARPRSQEARTKSSSWKLVHIGFLSNSVSQSVISRSRPGFNFVSKLFRKAPSETLSRSVGDRTIKRPFHMAYAFVISRVHVRGSQTPALVYDVSAAALSSDSRAPASAAGTRLRPPRRSCRAWESSNAQARSPAMRDTISN